MRKLKDLLASPSEIEFLASKQLFVDQEKFLNRLGNPAQQTLVDLLKAEHRPLLVYTGQQIYTDYYSSTLSKIMALRDIASHAPIPITPLLLWVDTDRSGSDKLITRIVWPHCEQYISISIAPPGAKKKETRYVEIDALILKKAIDRLGTYLFQTHPDTFTRKRYKHLRNLFIAGSIPTLRDFNHRLTQFLLQENLDFDPPFIFLSRVLSAGVLTDAVNQCLNNLPDLIAVFNEEIDRLELRNIFPQAKRLSSDYLPLNYSCPIDFQRVRLRHEIKNGEHLATGACECGQRFLFNLGSRILDASEIVETNRWSPDITLPMMLNDFVSGIIVGRSSALYGIILNSVIQRVFGKNPVPGLIPRALGEDNSTLRYDSLLYRYLTEK